MSDFGEVEIDCEQCAGVVDFRRREIRVYRGLWAFVLGVRELRRRGQGR